MNIKFYLTDATRAVGYAVGTEELASEATASGGSTDTFTVGANSSVSIVYTTPSGEPGTALGWTSGSFHLVVSVNSIGNDLVITSGSTARRISSDTNLSYTQGSISWDSGSGTGLKTGTYTGNLGTGVAPTDTNRASYILYVGNTNTMKAENITIDLAGSSYMDGPWYTTGSGSFTANAVILVPGGSGFYLRDGFNRTVAPNGFGTADDGQTWALSSGGIDGSYEVANGVGHVESADTSETLRLEGEITTSSTFYVYYKTRAPTIGASGLSYFLVGSKASGVYAYGPGIRWRYVSGYLYETIVSHGGLQTSSTQTYVPGDWYHVRGLVTSENGVHGKAWKDGDSEPASWQISQNLGPVTTAQLVALVCYTTDASFVGEVDDIFIYGRNVAWFTVDAYLAEAAVTGDYTADAVLLDTQQGSFTASATILATQASGDVLLRDTFSRTVAADGFGTSDDGHAYSTYTSLWTGSYEVSGGVGVADGESQIGAHASETVPSGFSVLGRARTPADLGSGETSSFWAGARTATNGKWGPGVFWFWNTDHISARATVAYNTGIGYAGYTTVSPGDWVWFRGYLTNGAYYSKIWKDGDAEPTAWTLEGGSSYSTQAYVGFYVDHDTAAGALQFDDLLVYTGPFTPFTVDAVITATVEPTAFTADANITGGAVTGDFTADAALLDTQADSFSADAVFLETQTGDWAADAVLLETEQGSLSSDATIQATVEGAVTLDAVILAMAEESLSADAVFLETQTGDFTADATVLATVQGSLTANAAIFATLETSFSADASLLWSETGDFTADAVALDTPTGAISFDAWIAGWFTADAWIAAESVTGDFSAAAVIQKTQTFGLQQIAFDTFTEASDTDLSSHTADSGQTWAFRGENTDTAFVNATSDRASWYDPTDDYNYTLYSIDLLGDGHVLATLYFDGSYSASAGLFSRMDPSAPNETHYAVELYESPIKLYRVTSLGWAQIGGNSGLFGPDTRVRFEFSGVSPTGLKVRIWQDGTSEPESWIIDTTDNNAANQRASGLAGVFGFGYSTNWTELDNFEAWQSSGGIEASATLLGTSPGSFSADATIQSTEAGDLSADAITLRQQGETMTADAAVLRTQQVIPGFTADAELNLYLEDSFSANAGIDPVWFDWSETWSNTVGVSTKYGDYTADAALLDTVAGSLTADAILTRTLAASFTADACILATGTGTSVADAVLLATRPASFDADAALLASIEGSFAADAVLLETQTGSFTADATALVTTSGSFSADASLAGALTFDAFIAPHFSADAFIVAPFSGFFSVDAALTRSITSTFTADAAIVATRAASFTADAAVQALGSGERDFDAVIVATQSASLTADAVSIAGQSNDYTADATLFGQVSNEYSADAFIVAPFAGSFSADAAIAATRSGSLTASASLAGAFTADAFILGLTGSSTTFDAVITGQQSGQFSADAIATAYASATLSASSLLTATLTGSLAADSTIAKTGTTAFTADAAVLAARTDGLVVDAVLASPETGSLTADAVIAGLHSFTADALILGGLGITFTADAVIIWHRIPVITATHSADILKATNDADVLAGTLSSNILEVANSAAILAATNSYGALASTTDTGDFISRHVGSVTFDATLA